MPSERGGIYNRVLRRRGTLQYMMGSYVVAASQLPGWGRALRDGWDVHELCMYE